MSRGTDIGGEKKIANAALVYDESSIEDSVTLSRYFNR
jgi:hypothetical protein